MGRVDVQLCPWLYLVLEGGGWVMTHTATLPPEWRNYSTYSFALCLWDFKGTQVFGQTLSTRNVTLILVINFSFNFN